MPAPPRPIRRRSCSRQRRRRRAAPGMACRWRRSAGRSWHGRSGAAAISPASSATDCRPAKSSARSAAKRRRTSPRRIRRGRCGRAASDSSIDAGGDRQHDADRMHDAVGDQFGAGIGRSGPRRDRCRSGCLSVRTFGVASWFGDMLRWPEASSAEMGRARCSACRGRSQTRRKAASASSTSARWIASLPATTWPCRTCPGRPPSPRRSRRPRGSAGCRRRCPRVTGRSSQKPSKRPGRDIGEVERGRAHAADAGDFAP